MCLSDDNSSPGTPSQSHKLTSKVNAKMCDKRLSDGTSYEYRFTTVVVKGSTYSITECGVPELIPVLGSQPPGDVSHKPGGEAATTFRQACSYPRNP